MIQAYEFAVDKVGIDYHSYQVLEYALFFQPLLQASQVKHNPSSINSILNFISIEKFSLI